MNDWRESLVAGCVACIPIIFAGVVMVFLLFLASR